MHLQAWNRELPARNPLIAKLGGGVSLEETDRVRLLELGAKKRQVPARKEIIREGDNPTDVHLIVKGFACRYKVVSNGRRSIMAILIPGDFCDLDVAILSHMDHSIGTLTPCVVVDIPRATVNELVNDHPNIARALRWCTLVDEATLREWLANMGQRQADRQLAHFICELRLRQELVGLADQEQLYLPLTQEEMGDVLGISAVHVNRVLQKLREQNLVVVRGRQVTIPDISRLEEYADFNPEYLHLRPN